MRSTLIVSKVTVLSVLIFLTQFISLPYFSWYNYIRYFAILIVSIYVIRRYKYLMKKKYVLVNLFVLLFSLMLIGTSYLNRYQISSRNPFLASIVFVSLLLTFLGFMEIMIEKKQVHQVINVFFKTAMIVLLITDVLIVLFPNLYLSFGENYFVGTKFEVVYLHFFLACLYMGKINRVKFNRSESIIAIGMLLWTFCIGTMVKCSTGIVGTVILLLLLFLMKKRENLFMNPISYMVVQCLCFSFIFFCEFILNNPTIETFIVDILGKNTTMSGRLNIYAYVPIMLTRNNAWMTGFGYATSYEIGRRSFGFPDTQNGILEWIWNAGIPTTIIMIISFMSILYISKKYSSNINKKALFPMIGLLYLLTILGTVEITISQMYFAVFICVMGMALGNKEIL